MPSSPPSEPGKTVWYFAYGSNLSIGQMLCRVGEWQTSKRAFLPKWELTFNVNSPRWGGKAANIKPTRDDRDKVLGVIYSITLAQLEVLTGFEHKEPRLIEEVETQDGRQPAYAYVFDSTKPPGRAPEAYWQTIQQGLRQHGYTEQDIADVKRIAVCEG